LILIKSGLFGESRRDFFIVQKLTRQRNLIYFTKILCHNTKNLINAEREMTCLGSISRRKKTVVIETDSAVSQSFFVDRETQRDAFNKNLGEVSNDGSRLIYYAGVGGVGKTALIRELESSFQGTTKEAKFKYVSYDFTYGSYMLTVLNALKKLSADKYDA